MKNVLCSAFVAIIMTSYSCTSQNTVIPAKISTLLNSNKFTFVAEKANPTNYDVINVINAMPNSTATRVLNLSPGYTIMVGESQLEVDLPYFGRVYNPSMDQTKAGIRLSSKKFSVDKSQNKKGNWVYKITPQDENSIRYIYIEVYKNGKAFASVDSNDRQPITYDGYIMKNEAKN